MVWTGTVVRWVPAGSEVVWYCTPFLSGCWSVLAS